VRNEISLIMNFDLKENADHQAVIGRDQFTLVAKGKNLWVKNPAEERRVIEAMKRANDLVVKGVSARSNATQDRYSLKGFGDALERVQQECR
ncbi:MAG TPA: invasion associated locus B family protein, partial [Microvirga sp.]|nr:invasion associated locus B family protein [Microvirga sp.]